MNAVDSFKFEVSRSRGWDKKFVAKVENAMLDQLDTTTLRYMKADLYMNTNFSWINEQLDKVQKTFGRVVKQNER